MENVLLEETHDIPLEEVFLAYYQCRKNKRNKIECLEYDMDYEIHLIRLWEEIKTGDYKISPLSVFIADKIKRKIFASPFKDRIVHHLIVMKLEPLFEKEFIYDTYSCRAGMGTHFGIERVNKFIRSCSNNYQKECYVLKMDIKGYFININKAILFDKLRKFIIENYRFSDINVLISICQQVIMKDATENCIVRSSVSRWEGLPKTKSLFHSEENCGIPIGNYTNQVFANFYLNKFDYYIKSTLKIKYYGRYVDDFILISGGKEKLVCAIPKIKEYLKNNLKLEIHPKKIYLQNVERGVEFLGAYLKPWRKYITPRIKNSFYITVKEVNEKIKKCNLSKNEKEKIQMKLNSCLGALSHLNTYNLRTKFVNMLNLNFWNYFYLSNDHLKVLIK